MIPNRNQSPASPGIVFATPSGQEHELGALAAAVIAGSAGWRVSYLGTNLPGEEIALAARKTQSRAIALSIVYPPDDPYLPAEMEKLRFWMGMETPIILGGRSAAAYGSQLASFRFTWTNSLGEFRLLLDRLRETGHAGGNGTTV
jgi:methylmalonyl-CoA mutase cobalamin-binding subunit